MNAPTVLVISGSARPDGDTAAALDALAYALAPGGCERIDLVTLRLAPFRYAGAARDDFDHIVTRMLAHRTIVLATPVYWYAMSGLMKNLFDRLTDTLSGRDPASRGRSLAGCSLALLATGTDPDLPVGFEVPFARTADYLGMEWRGGFYLAAGHSPDERARRLADLAGALGAPTRRKDARIPDTSTPPGPGTVSAAAKHR